MSRGDRENRAAGDTGAQAELHAEQLDRSKPVLSSLQQELTAISEEEFLRTYDAGDYERPSVTVDMLVFTIRSEEQENYRKLAEPELGLLLIRRGGHPYLGQWALPGDSYPCRNHWRMRRGENYRRRRGSMTSIWSSSTHGGCGP